MKLKWCSRSEGEVVRAVVARVSKDLQGEWCMLLKNITDRFCPVVGLNFTGVLGNDGFNVRTCNSLNYYFDTKSNSRGKGTSFWKASW